MVSVLIETCMCWGSVLIQRQMSVYMSIAEGRFVCMLLILDVQRYDVCMSNHHITLTKWICHFSTELSFPKTRPKIPVIAFLMNWNFTYCWATDCCGWLQYIWTLLQTSLLLRSYTESRQVRLRHSSFYKICDNNPSFYPLSGQLKSYRLHIFESAVKG